MKALPHLTFTWSGDYLSLFHSLRCSAGARSLQALADSNHFPANVVLSLGYVTALGEILGPADSNDVEQALGVVESKVLLHLAYPLRHVVVIDTVAVECLTIDWVYHDGVRQYLPTVLATDGVQFLVCRPEEFPLAPEHAIDRMLFQIELAHLAASGT